MPDQIQIALHLANLCAPNGKVQAAFIRLREEAEKDHKEGDWTPVVRAILHGITNGLEYGNWPE